MPVSRPRRRCVGATVTIVIPSAGTVPPPGTVSSNGTLRRVPTARAAVERAPGALQVGLDLVDPERGHRRVPAGRCEEGGVDAAQEVGGVLRARGGGSRRARSDASRARHPIYRPRVRLRRGRRTRRGRRAGRDRGATARPQLRRAAAGAAGRAGRRADPVRVAADRRVHPALHHDQLAAARDVRGDPAVRRVRGRAAGRAGGVPPDRVPAQPEGRPGPGVAPDGPGRAGLPGRRAWSAVGAVHPRRGARQDPGALVQRRGRRRLPAALAGDPAGQPYPRGDGRGTTDPATAPAW